MPPKKQPASRNAMPMAQAQRFLTQGRASEALAIIEPLIRRTPDDLQLCVLMAECQLRLHQRDKAFYFAERALAKRPNDPHLLLLRADAAPRRIETTKQLEFYDQAILANPMAASAHTGRARVLVKLARSPEAEESLRRACELEPTVPAHVIALANHISESGDAGEACELLSAAIKQHPHHMPLLRAYAIASNYAHDMSASEITDIHRRLGAAIAKPVRATRTFRNDPDPNRPLRIGVLSADMRRHSVAFFLEPVLEHLAPSLHATCYSLSKAADEYTLRFRQYADAWREAHGMNHSQLATSIAEDQIDVLIDTTGHFAGTQAPILAARPAPVSISYCGYPNTSGIPSVAARLVDPVTDPSPAADEHATEQLIRLDPCFLCYRPPDEAPSPADPSGPFTFGSFNAVKKYTPATLDSWARILTAAPDARLLLKHHRFHQPDALTRFTDEFARRGVSRDRLDLLPSTPNLKDHLATYQRVHLALDPFPYNGTTTTCEALWMGVPLVAFAGDRHASRVSASLLLAAGLPGLVAQDQESYEHLAVELATNTSRLNHFRSGLRERVAASPLCDAPAFAIAFERAVREVWRTWCNNPV